MTPKNVTVGKMVAKTTGNPISKSMSDILTKPRPSIRRPHALRSSGDLNTPSVRYPLPFKPTIIRDKPIDVAALKHYRPHRAGTSRRRYRGIMGFSVAMLVAGVGLAWAMTSSAAGDYSLWNAAVTPKILSVADNRSIELGLKFQPKTDGQINGVRFYKSSRNSGTHSGSLWSKDGHLLATATTIDETTSGWQQLSFSHPVSVTAAATYVVSYHAPHGSYSMDPGYFKSTARITHDLVAPQDNSSDGPTGVYAYSSGIIFPAQGNNASNFWVDVDFTPNNELPADNTSSTQI